MKSILPVLALLLAAAPSGFSQTNFYSQKWSDVYRYEMRALPRSVLRVVDSVYARAKKERNMPQFTKAVLYQGKIAIAIEPEEELAAVRKFKKEIESTVGSQRSILESILAEVYWEYFSMHRDKYYARTYSPDNSKIEDFRLWDARTILEAVHGLYQASVKNEKALQDIQLDSIDEILVSADSSRTYRPTLFDLLVYRAIDFYSLTDELINRQENSVFLPEHAVPPLYQSLLSFHAGRRDTAAFVDAALGNWKFLAQRKDDSDKILLSELYRQRPIYRHHPASTLIDYEIASLLNSVGATDEREDLTTQFRLRDARQLCDSAISLFPNSMGANKCRALRESILATEISIRMEDYITVNHPALASVNFRNIDRLAFSAYPVSDELCARYYRSYQDSLVLKELPRLVAIAQWEVKLNAPEDHRHHDTEVRIPRLPGGRYLIYLKPIAIQGTETDDFAYDFIQVTDLALLETFTGDDTRFQVVDRNNGSPVSNANVSLKSDSSDNWLGTHLDKKFTTDSNGFFELGDNSEYRVTAIITTENDRAIYGRSIYNYGRNKSEGYNIRSFLFTDRSIYRPGQTAYFKGILLKIKDNKSSLVAGEYVNVALLDVNFKEKGNLRLKTNAFGSFSGEFQIPAIGLTGEYTIEVDEDDSEFYDKANDFLESEVQISVEEYKRPTFEINFEPLAGTFKIGDTIRVHGNAEAFNGAKVVNAEVRYRVNRVPESYWHYEDESDFLDNGDELTDDETETGSNGDFVVEFIAEADESSDENERPVFVYSVIAEITDINGETRNASTQVKIGYHTMKANVTINQDLNKTLRQHRILITTENLNGRFVASTGHIKIYKLLSPDVPVRRRRWSAPELRTMTKAEFKRDFLHEAWTDEDDREAWKNGKLMKDILFNTGQSTEAVFSTDASWPNGSYVAELMTTDNEGQLTTSRATFNIYDPKNRMVSDQQLLTLEADKASYNEGEVMHVKIGSATDDVTVTLDVATDARILKTYVVHLSGSTKELLVPIPTSKSSKIYLNYHSVVYNSFVASTRTISIDKEETRLGVEAITFRDKLQPGSKETWSFEITGTSQGRKEAEVLASMYDASLDDFKKHDWKFNPPSYSVGPFNRTDPGDCFNVNSGTVYRAWRHVRLPYFQNYDEFDLFGFSVANSSYVKRQYESRLYSSGINPFTPSKVTKKNSRGRAEGYVYGRIISREGSAITGVNIVVKGTTRGTISDLKGEYAIEVKRGETLVYSFVGYATAEDIVDHKNVMNVLMEEDVTALEEVVVVGYGVQQKKSLTGSVVTVEENAVTEGVDEVSFSVLLSGRVAGVQITNGAAINSLTIRGLSSVDQQKVIYVVDDVVVTSTRIPEEDIASMDVIKGDAAVALYGSKASYGVIVITTKSGQRKINSELAKVNARKNFNETAFFFPHLTTDETGKVRFTFTTPESLTRWKLQLFAHTRDLNYIKKTFFTTTQKEIMVTPNMPRFLRSGDEVLLSVKISNLSSKTREGKASLQLTNPLTGQTSDEQFGNIIRGKSFKIPGKGSTELSWRLKIPSGVDIIQYRVVAKAGNVSDGEQNVLPILSNRILVTETLPMFVRSGQSRSFKLDKLSSVSSQSIQQHRLTLEITSNPAWYAIKALPYLMEFPYECAEQLFSRYYANTLGSYIVNSQPSIREIFEKWNNQALTSNLEGNPELKSILIEETPWLREAEDEKEQRKRLSALFDVNSLKVQQDAIVTKLSSMQLADGGFTWFPGSGYSNRYISQHIASSFGHLKQLGITDHSPKLLEMIRKDIAYLDKEIINDYQHLEKNVVGIRTAYLANQHISHEHIHYLYSRSFFAGESIGDELSTVIAYYMDQSRKYWPYFGLQEKAMIAMIHFRNNDLALARDILRSLKESSMASDELGMYWKDNKAGWYWFEAPIETQALLIEAFKEIGSENSELDEIRTWLLKNKLVNRWKTTKATTEAIYAILLTGSNWTSSNEHPEVIVGGKAVEITEDNAEPGTGYFKTSWTAGEIKPVMSDVTIKGKSTVSNGALYWQYFEDMDKVTPAETSLSLKKKMFVVTDQGSIESMIELHDTTKVAVGDLIRIRIQLTTDRQMEFLHLKDQRASGMEPVDVLSEFKWQDGLGYYQSTKDAATHFFFERIKPGAYTFEYDLRVNNKGTFSNGIANIESMYAPEFSSHSSSVRINVR